MQLLTLNRKVLYCEPGVPFTRITSKNISDSSVKMAYENQRLVQLKTYVALTRQRRRSFRQWCRRVF